MAASSTRALLGALSANLAIAATKFIVAAITGSTVMLAEGIHSLVDSGNSALMLFGQRRSRRPADATHPFGYGMELYFWSFVVAMVVFGGGGGLSIYEGVRALIHPRPISSAWPSYLVIGAAAVFEAASLAIGLRELKAYGREKRFTGSLMSIVRTGKNPAIFLTVLEDGAALLGLAIAAAGIALEHLTSIPEVDGVASILIGLVLVIEASVLGYECRELIIGEAARPIVADTILRILARHRELGVTERLRTLQLGADAILVVLRVRLDPALVGAELERAVERLVIELRGAIPAIHDVVFEIPAPADPPAAA